MEKFRFPPARPRSLFIAALAFVTVVLALPAIVHAVLPPHPADVEQVTLSDPSQDWDITVPDLYCERDYTSLASVGWTCGDALFGYCMSGYFMFGYFMFEATKSQLTRFQNASTYFGRRLR